MFSVVTLRALLIVRAFFRNGLGMGRQDLRVDPRRRITRHIATTHYLSAHSTQNSIFSNVIELRRIDVLRWVLSQRQPRPRF